MRFFRIRPIKGVFEIGLGEYRSRGVPLVMPKLNSEKRDQYMAALESASVQQDIEPFAMVLGRLVSERLEGQPAPQIPTS